MAAALLAGLLLGFALRPVPAAAEEEPEVDRLEVAALLLRDGQYGRAAKVLAEIDPEAESVDQARYHTLYGLALLEEKDFDGAGDHFEAALDAGAMQPQIVLRLAQARFEAGRYREVIAALDRGGAPVDALPAAHLLRAQAYWRAGDTAAAYAALETGLARHPDEARLLEQEILLLLEMKLFQAARAKAERFLRRAGASADDFVLVAEATRRAGAADEAIVQLEEARLRFPRSERVAVALARAYVEAGRPLAAAVVLQEASRFHPR
ncbi:MAG: tetratricopeptide repeat protein, partial [Deltaproteobacteria bacterium]